MFCENATGKLLPPMVVYKAKFIYDGWVNGGPKGLVFDALILAGLMGVLSKNGL